MGQSFTTCRRKEDILVANITQLKYSLLARANNPGRIDENIITIRTRSSRKTVTGVMHAGLEKMLILFNTPNIKVIIVCKSHCFVLSILLHSENIEIRNTGIFLWKLQIGA
jgi:hypothetical protein